MERTRYDGSFYVKVHSCNVQLKDSFSKNISAQLVHLDPASETLSPSKSSENVADMHCDNPLSSNVNESPNFNLTENANSVENQVSIQNAKHNFPNNDLNEQAFKYTSTEKSNNM